MFSARSKNKASAALIVLAVARLASRNFIAQWFCEGAKSAFLRKRVAAITGVTTSSPVIWVGLLARFIRLAFWPLGAAGYFDWN